MCGIQEERDRRKVPKCEGQASIGGRGIRIRYLPRDDAVCHFLKSHTYCLVLAPSQGSSFRKGKNPTYELKCLLDL